MPKKAFIFDGNSFCYRAFYAIGHMSTSKGEPTNAIYGFLTMIRKIIEGEEPDYIAICFDRKEKTFRHAQYEKYKVHRKPMPDELSQQLPHIQDIVRAYNIPLFEKAGFEADDLLGTLAVRLEKLGIDVYIVTSDKDALQLVNNKIKTYSTYRDTVSIYDIAKVKERYSGLGPESIIDIMGLMGDASDNIPGIPGIGEKTAVAYIKEFGSLDNLIAKADSLKSEAKRKLIHEYADLARLSRELATIDCAVPIDFELEKLERQEPNVEELMALLQRFELRSFLRDLAVAGPPEEAGRQYVTIDTVSQLQKLVADLEKQKAFAFDTETTSASSFSAELVGMSFSFKAKEAYYVVLTHDKIATDKGIPLSDGLRMLRPVLENEKISKYGQNIKYDYIVLRRAGIRIRGIRFDTMIAAYLINPVKLNQNLDDISLEYLNVKKITFHSLVGTGKDQKRIDEVPVREVSTYACEDADCVFRLVSILERQLKEKEVEKLFYEIEMPLLEVLAEVELNGVTIDETLLKNLSSKAENALEGLTQKIYDCAGEEFNINSPKQLGVILFEKLKLPVVKKTKTGPSTDVTVLETLALEHELPKYLLEYREYSKLKSTYLDALPALVNPETGRIHTSFNQTATVTGRLSSSAPNMQNIPIKTELGREIRKAFVPRAKTRVIISADYSQIELRFLAHFSGDTTLVNAFQNNLDIHTVTAALLYNVDESDVTSEMRTLGKTINFSIIYGKTPFGLSRDLGIPVKEAKAFIDAYFLRYGKIKTYLDSLKETACAHGYVTTLLGRRALFPDITSTNATVRQFAERAATNAPLQGSAADLIKKAMIVIQGKLEKNIFDAYMLLQVHDELVFDVAKKESDEFSSFVRSEMENALTLTVPLKVDVHIGPSWYK
jgi:DNA polymerase-1